MTAVLDASALLGFLQDEPGNDRVEAVLPEAVISSVNWAEVVQKSIMAGVDVMVCELILKPWGWLFCHLPPRKLKSRGRSGNKPVNMACRWGIALV